MVIVQVDDLATEKTRLAETDIRIIWETNTERASAVHLHPKDVPGRDRVTGPDDAARSLVLGGYRLG